MFMLHDHQHIKEHQKMLQKLQVHNSTAEQIYAQAVVYLATIRTKTEKLNAQLGEKRALVVALEIILQKFAGGNKIVRLL